MDLRGGDEFWQEIDGRPPSGRELAHDQQCDVAVIGGGVSGALSAYMLTEAGLDVVLLDKRLFGEGSTTASTGLLQYEIDVPLVELAKQVGTGHAARAYKVCVKALAEFEPLVRRLGDRCGLVKRQSLYLAVKEKDVAELREECAARQACDIGVEFLPKEMLRREFDIERPGALLSKDAAEIDPYRFTMKLMEKAVRQGLRAYAPVKVMRYEHRPADVILHTEQGRRIEAKHVIFATGYETPEFLDAGTTQLKSTYALATAPLEGEGWGNRPLIWEKASPYFYLRAAPGGRVVVGGEDDDFVDPARRDASIKKKAALLEKKLAALCPWLHATTQRRWAGTFAETEDGLPYIGQYRKFPRGWFMLGYGGNGITFSLIAARLIRDAIMGKPAKDMELFGFDR